MGDVDSESPTGVLTLGGVNQTHYEGMSATAAEGRHSDVFVYGSNDGAVLIGMVPHSSGCG